MKGGGGGSRFEENAPSHSVCPAREVVGVKWKVKPSSLGCVHLRSLDCYSMSLAAVCCREVWTPQDEGWDEGRGGGRQEVGVS